jgi:hypothetical protein
MPRASVNSMLRLALACLALGLFAVVPAANAASTTQILRDCADDGVLQGDYTPAELRKARQNIPTDTDQYTDCRDVIARAASARAAGGSGDGGSGSGSGGPGGGGGGGGGQPLTPTDDRDRASLEDAARTGGAPVDIGGRPVVPGAVGLNAASRHDIPASVIVLFVLLAIGALAAAAPGARRTWGSVSGFYKAHAPGRDG